MQKNKKNKVAIIGGGITGLVSAYKLLQNNANVSIFEKSGFLGGLASSTKIEGVNIEKLYHHFFNTDLELISLLKDLDLEKDILWQKSKIAIFYKNKIYPFSTAKDMLFFPPFDNVSKLRFALVSLYLKIKPSSSGLKKQKAHFWLKKYFGKKIYKIIWYPLLKNKYKKYYRQISMAWMWARIHKRSNSRSKNNSSEMLAYLKGSLAVLIHTLEKKIIKMGGEIHLNTEIKKISTNIKTKKKLIFYKDKKELFDNVICTTPSNIFSKLINKKRSKIKYMDSLCILFSSSQNISPYYWINICDYKSPFSVFIQHTNFVNKKNYKNKHIYYLGGYFNHEDHLLKTSDSFIKMLTVKSIKKMFPTFMISKIKDFKVFKFEDAQHIVDNNFFKKQDDAKCFLQLLNSSQNIKRDVNQAVSRGLKIAKNPSCYLTKKSSHVFQVP